MTGSASGVALAWTCTCHPTSYWGYGRAFEGCPITDIGPEEPTHDGAYTTAAELEAEHDVTAVAWLPVL